MKKLVFTGCSFTAGCGWDGVDCSLGKQYRQQLDAENQAKNPDNKEYPWDLCGCNNHEQLWVNLCHKNIPEFQKLELLNLGQGGASNHDIFENTTEIISKHNADIEYLVCQWTAMPRYNFRVGLELWSTHEQLHNHLGRGWNGVNLNKGDSWTRSHLSKLYDQLMVLHHLHGEIVKVVRYSNIIANLCKHIGIKFIFVNGLCPWDDNYFTRITGDSVKPDQYTKFTQDNILNIDSRNDEDIFKLYKQAHNEYDSAGGVRPAEWSNLYNSMLNSQIDKNNDKQHPGTQSNQLYFQQIKTFLEH